MAEFAELKAGESRSFYVQAPLLDEQEKDLEHQVEAEARVKDRVEEVIRKNASTINGLEALKADLSVKKTADKETAAPGETVTYQDVYKRQDLYIAQGGMSNVIYNQARRDKRGV